MQFDCVFNDSNYHQRMPGDEVGQLSRFEKEFLNHQSVPSLVGAAEQWWLDTHAPYRENWQ